MLLLFLLNFSALDAQEQLSLSQAIERGLQNNYDIQIAQKEIDIARNNNTWKSAGRFPTINFNLNVDNSFSGQNNPASFLQRFTSAATGFTGSIDATYTLFDGYRVKINKQRFEALEKQNEGNAKVAIENTVREIILAYYEALIQKESLETVEELLILSKDRVDYQATRSEFGQAGRFDLLQSEDAYFNDSTNYLINLNAFDLALRNLNLAMGEDQQDMRYDLTDELSFTAQPYAFEDLREKMLASNQNLQNLYVSLSLANIEQDAARSNRYPTLSLNGGANYGASFSGINVLEAPPTFMVESPVTNSNYTLY
ncbi:MAG: TolC family protein, partial [Bacteroidota bacterium]